MFYHIRSFSANEIYQTLMKSCVANFTTNRSRMKGELVSEHNEIQNEIILCLKNKRFSEGKSDFF